MERITKEKALEADNAVGDDLLTTLYHDYDVRREGKLEGILEGRQEGENIQVVKQICRKLRKSKTPDIIADEIEEDIVLVKKICYIAKAYAPDYDEKTVYEAAVNASIFENIIDK